MERDVVVYIVEYHSRDTRFPVLYPVSWLNTLTKQHSVLYKIDRFIIIRFLRTYT